MSKKRMVDTKFWSDSYVANLDSLEKLLFMYFITNQYTNICGIYEIPLKQVSLDTGIDRENIEKAFLPRFERAGKIYYIDGWIYIKNFLKHQKASGNVKLGIENGQKEVPDEIMAKIKAIEDTGGTQVGHSLKLELESELELEPNGYVPSVSKLPEEIQKTWNKFTNWQELGVPQAKIRNTSVIRKLLPEFRKITPEFVAVLKKRKIALEDATIAIQNYIKDIVNRVPDKSTFHEHRFSCYEFFKQENGFLKFINK